MPAKKTKRKKSKPKPQLYVKQKRFKLSAVVLFSLVCLVIIVGSVLGSVDFANDPEEELFNDTGIEPEPVVPLVPEITKKAFLTDLEIDSLTTNGTFVIRLVDLPTTQLGINLVSLGRKNDIRVERIKYPADCSETKDPSILRLCPQDQNMIPVVAIYRPEKGPIVFSGRRAIAEIEELMNGTIVPSVYFYQEKCTLCPHVFNPFILSLPGSVFFENINKSALLESGADSYPTFVLKMDDLIFQDYTQNLNLFILENSGNVSARQSGQNILMTSNPTATFNDECNNSLTHFYAPDCGNCLGYSVCEVFNNETNETAAESIVGEKKRGCEYYEGISQIIERYPEINYQEVCIGPLCNTTNAEVFEANMLTSRYGVQSVPTLIYNCKYREEGFQNNQEARIVKYSVQLNPYLNLTFGEDLSNVTVPSDTNSSLLSDSGGEEKAPPVNVSK